MVFQFLRNRSVRAQLNRALQDGVLTDEEVADISSRATELNVPQEYLDNVKAQYLRGRLENIKTAIVATGTFSADQEATLAQLSKNLRMAVDIGDGLDMYKQIWRLENDKNATPTPIRPRSQPRLTCRKGNNASMESGQIGAR